MSDWVSVLLGKMGAPDNNTTRTAMYGWADSEGMPASENNWLATTLNCCGCTPINSDGVCTYPTVNDGAEAIWQTLQGSAYTGIVSWFRRGDNIREIWAAINASPWCSGCQNGHYPIVLYNSITQGGGVPPSGGGAGGTARHPTPLPPTNVESDDWSSHVRNTGIEFRKIAYRFAVYRNSINKAVRG